MRPGLSRAVVAAVALFATGATGVTSDAGHWQALARADLDAIHAHILEAHPGVIDPDNPGFGIWVEKGYGQAKAFLPYVESYDTALAVMRYYAAGFEDGHLVYSDNARGNFPVVVTGWYVARQKGRYVVANALADWPVPLPPVGARWTGCDGQISEEVLRARIAPFADRRAGTEAEEHRLSELWMRMPVADNLRECTFVTDSGESLSLPVAYHAISSERFFAALPTDDGGARAANAFALQDGVLWVRAGNFSLRNDSTDQTELAAMLDGLRKVRDVRAIVFDSRGNGGGDSGIGDRIFEAAVGGLDFDQGRLDSLPRYYAQWRVSDHLLRYLDSTTRDLQALYGVDSPRVAENLAFRADVAAALTAGQTWVEQDAGRTITRADVAARHGHLRRFDAKVALLTDHRCASACLDFADIVLQVPRVLHVGQTTGADSVYLVGSRSELPSGNVLVMPVKVWRNRARGNNEALVPDVPVDLDQGEAAIRRDVLAALGMK